MPDIRTCERTYRISPVCLTKGHLMDDGSIPTCMRRGCDEGMATIDHYLDIEVEECYCDDPQTPCPWNCEEE